MPSAKAILGGIAAGVLIFGIIISFVFFQQNRNKIYPNIFIGETNVGGLTKQQAETLLSRQQQQFLNNTNYPLTVAVNDISISSSSAELGLHQTHKDSIDQAFKIARSKNPIKNIKQLAQLISRPQTVSLHTTYEAQQVATMVKELAKKVDIIGVEPSAKLQYSGSPSSLIINPGKIGREVQQNLTSSTILDAADSQTYDFEAIVASTATELNTQQVESFREKALPFVGKRIYLKSNGTSLKIGDQEIISLLAYQGNFSETELQERIKEWSTQIGRSPQNAIFEYDPKTLIVHQFKPHRQGLELNIEKTKNQLAHFFELISNEKLEGDAYQDQIHVITTEPEITLEETNNLGIKELIGFGESEYAHSIPSRIHNVAITTQKISGTLVAPGEEFSFNKTLGDVSSQTGYRPAYVISEGRTVLGDGGGVCQVSSTTFRALLDSGLQITRRLPHSYRVSYYELNSDPGFDATVYSGNIDLRFINDTDHYVLIYGQADSQNVYMKIEIYGTSDGRTIEISDYKKWGYSPPPPAQYYPDPSLPTGKLKQIDWAASGIKASFIHTIKDKDGNTISQKTYTSSYQPWAAKFLQGI